MIEKIFLIRSFVVTVSRLYITPTSVQTLFVYIMIVLPDVMLTSTKMFYNYSFYRCACVCVRACVCVLASVHACMWHPSSTSCHTMPGCTRSG